MSFQLEEVELLQQIARDATAGRTLEERLEVITDSLGPLIPSASLSVLVVPSASGGGQPSCARAYFRDGDPDDAREYAAHYMQFDPCSTIGSQYSGQVGTLSDFVPANRFGKDPFTGEFLPRQNLKYVLGSMLAMPDGNRMFFAMHREPGQGDFTGKERQVLRLIQADLSRAASGALLREHVRALRAHRLPRQAREGAIIVDDQGAVLDADPGAVSICEQLADDLPVKDIAELAGSLSRGDPSRSSYVERVVALPRSRVSLLLRCSETRVGSGRALLCVLRLLPPDRSADRFDELATQYALTPREREVAALAIEGLGNRHIGHKLGISPVTVSVTLSRVYRKTNVTSRTELTRLLSRGEVADWTSL